MEVSKEDKLNDWVEENIFSKCVEELDEFDTKAKYLHLKEVDICFHRVHKRGNPEIRSFKKEWDRYINEKDVDVLKGQEVGKTIIVGVFKFYSGCKLYIHLALKNEAEEVSKDTLIKIWEGLDENGNDIWSINQEEEKIEEVEVIKEEDLF